MKKIIFYENNSISIYEAFGYKDEIIEALKDAFVKYALSLLEKNQEISKTKLMEQFLQQSDFEHKFHIKTDEPNFYFMLGYIFNIANEEITEVMIEKALKKALANALQNVFGKKDEESDQEAEEKPRKKRSILDPVD